MPIEDTKEVFLLLGRMEGKIDAVLNKQTEQAMQHEKLVERVARLETHNSKQAGALTSLFTAGKAVWAVIGAAGVYVYKLYLEK